MCAHRHDFKSELSEEWQEIINTVSKYDVSLANATILSSYRSVYKKYLYCPPNGVIRKNSN